MAIGPGSRIGPYEVTALIGEGGMGKVWQAHHAALKRDDALKVLSDAFASDPDRLARFQREAQVLASFNHPNIAHVHGLEQANGVQALVMALVEGPTLADRIAQGPIPVDEALPMAKQIAEALEAAHEQGIIHRDLKPANIKLWPDGTVKVLDFGLAKALGPPEGGHYVQDGRSVRLKPDLTASPTITSPALMTGVGLLLGTAAYVNPEQVKGHPADFPWREPGNHVCSSKPGSGSAMDSFRLTAAGLRTCPISQDPRMCSCARFSRLEPRPMGIVERRRTRLRSGRSRRRVGSIRSGGPMGKRCSTSGRTVK